MNPQSSSVQPTNYYVQLGTQGTQLTEASTLRDAAAQLRAFHLSSLADVYIEASIPGWHLTVTVPFEEYGFLREGVRFLQPVEVVAEHWSFPVPERYFALDWNRGIYIEAPRLPMLVESLHATGTSFVDTKAIKIGARFVREGAQGEDVIQVPLSFICHDYFPDDEQFPEEVVDPNDPEGFGQCSFLPPAAELLPPQLIEPHFLFGFLLRDRRRLRDLLQDDENEGETRL